MAKLLAVIFGLKENRKTQYNVIREAQYLKSTIEYI
jgi:hypothetical protein